MKKANFDNLTKIQSYVLGCISEEATKETQSETVLNAFKIFKSEKVKYDTRRLDQRSLLVEWFQGLCNTVEVEYRNHAILELAHPLGYNTKTETEEEVFLESWFVICADAFLDLVKIARSERRKKIVSIHVEGRKWFDKVNGNTYHSSTSHIAYSNGTSKEVYTPMAYGYGNQYQYSAKAAIFGKDKRSLWGICDDKGIVFSYSESDVKKRDL